MLIYPILCPEYCLLFSISFFLWCSRNNVLYGVGSHSVSPLMGAMILSKFPHMENVANINFNDWEWRLKEARQITFSDWQKFLTQYLLILFFPFSALSPLPFLPHNFLDVGSDKKKKNGSPYFLGCCKPRIWSQHWVLILVLPVTRPVTLVMLLWNLLSTCVMWE